MRKTGGYVSIAFGVFMGVGVLASSNPEHALGARLFALFVFGIGPIVLGLLLVTAGRAKRPSELEARRAWDSELMRLAAKRHGSLTVAEVVAHADLDAESAERHLDDLCKRGLAEHRVT